MQSKHTVIAVTKVRNLQKAEWGYQITSTEDKKVSLKICTGSNSIVGRYTMYIDTIHRNSEKKEEKYRYTHPDDIFIIFNPWCKDVDDTVLFDQHVFKIWQLVATMRFFRRRRNSPETTQVRTDVPSNFIPGCWIVRWNSAFSSNAFSRNSLSESVTQYVPKCITSVSQSDILCGDRVENFSSDCWLQNHLDQFGNRFQRLTIPEVDYDEDDDSPVGSTASTEANSISSFEMDNEMEDEIVNRLYYANRNRLLDFPSYTEVVEPPPYGFTDLPPSYEEAIAGDQDRLSRRFSSSSSGVDFIWY